METSGSLGKRCLRKGGRGGSSPKQTKQHATRTCNSTGTRAATHKSPPSGTSGASTSVVTTGGMSLSAQTPLHQHRPPRPRSPVSEGLRRSNRRRTTYRPNNDDDDDSDPDDVDDKKDEDYDPDDNDLNDSDPDEDLNDIDYDPDDETTELLTKDERQRRRRNANKKARYNARYPEKARARNIRKKANYRHKYPEKVRAAKKRYVEQYPDRVRESKRRYEETHKEERRATKKQWARNNRARCVEYERRYREKNKERIRLRRREYRKNNRVRIVEYQWAYRAANREKLVAQGRKYYWDNREKMLEKAKRYYYNKRKKDVPRPKPLRVVLTDYRTQPSLEMYLNDFCASLPSIERQKTEEKIKALGPLKLTIPLEDFKKSTPKMPENLSFCESFLDSYTLTDMDSGGVQAVDPPDLGPPDLDPSDLEDFSSLLQNISPDDWTELLRDVEDSCSFDLEALVPPEDFVHDMSPDEGVDLMYDLVT